ncbi:family 78 glycoside hydrolase catalytic domain [uncultured Demequina sp.]|uniref:family 78 glycoside hydrolase catalytic domain n=1 Tax=uncultured Demequina sp. TaxID=693499 RepID=UPI0025D467EE|nr:family 78 glycoside hydrolase catalytic domain [uncultured Demequina sp.]
MTHAATPTDVTPALVARGLLTEDLDRPLAVIDPRFSWVLEGAGHDRRQTAYRIIVEHGVTHEVVWDSGAVASADQSRIAYRGQPLRPGHPYSWRVAVRDERERWSEPDAQAQFVTGRADDQWAASWIRPDSDEPDIDDDVYWYAETVVRLRTSDVAAATLHAAAAHDYELWVGDHRIGRGQSFDYPGESRYQGWDVTDAVRDADGEFTLRFHARWYGDGQGRAAGVIGLIAQLTVVTSDGQTETVATDAMWDAHDSAWSGSQLRNFEGDFVEECDGRLGSGPVEGTRRHVTVIGAHPTPVLAALVPELTPSAESPALPIAIDRLPDGSTVYDFGAVIPARISVTFNRGEAGRRVELTGGYSRDCHGRVATTVATTQETDMRFVYTQRDGSQTYSTLDHLGMRYLQISPAGEQMDLAQVRATVVHAEVPQGRTATFTSSEPILDDVFGLMRRSALLGAQNQFVDTPTREKGQFLQDAVNISQASMALFRERELTRKAIRQVLASQDRYWFEGDDAGRYNAVYPNGDGKRDIPDFSINMIGWVWDYFVESGDAALLDEAYPYLRRTAEYITRAIPASGPTAGLVTDLAGGKGPYLHGIVDWPAPGRFGYDVDTAARTTINALAFRAFEGFTSIARVLGRDTDADRAQASAETLRTAMNDRLLDARGYVDGLYADGSPSRHRSQHASSYPLAFGIAPATRVDDLGAYIASLGMRQGPMTAHYLVDALLAARLPAATLRLLTNTDDLGWAKLVADGHSFTWEQWTPGQSESHAWGATAATSLVRHFLGVSPHAQHGAHLTIAPDISVLERVEGTVHTERGPVSVSRVGVGVECTIDLTVPPNTSAIVSLPVHTGYSLTVQPAEAVLTTAHDVTGRATAFIGSGTYRFAYEGESIRR